MNLQFSAFNDKVSADHARQYAKNAAENYARIKAEFQKGDYSIDSLPRYPREAGIPALVLGSGPSLDDALPFIKDFKGMIFASPSQLDILEKWEIVPTYVVSVDSADSVGEEQIRTDRDCHGMTLLTHPYISPKTLDAWHGAKRYFELIEQDGHRHFRDVYPWIQTGFSVAGSVNNTEVIIADWMGCNPIILAGVDYCFPGGRKRAQDYRKRGPYIFDPKPQEMVETRDGLTTVSQETMFYANLLLGIWKMYRLPLVQLGDKGACTEIPFIKPEDLNHAMTIYPPDEAKIAEIDANMRDFGMYSEVDTSTGIGHFRWREEDLAAAEQAEKELKDARGRALLWQ